MTDGGTVLVLGLQKSGTSLLLRLLEDIRGFRNPVKFEGKELWGDDPPFAPEAFPAGAFYQRDGGERGHELGAAEATEEVVAYLRDALAGYAKPGKVLILKNPYNTVRVPWVRAALPDAHIVAIVRRPLPNVFSLLKKHAENPHVHRGPKEGWWGVKPAGWQELRSDDAVVQCARQWQAVNAKLWADRELVDRIVPYHELTADPDATVAAIAAALGRDAPDTDFPPLEALDDEHERGGLLESANKVYKRTGSLDLEGADRADERLDPFTAKQRETVLEICAETASELGLA